MSPICDVCARAAHWRKGRSYLCVGCLEDLTGRAQISARGWERIPEDADLDEPDELEELCGRCNLPESVHGHGELEARFGREADPSHRFEPKGGRS